MKKPFLRCLILMSLLYALTGCAVLLLGGGAAGGYYFANNYNVEKKNSS